MARPRPVLPCARDRELSPRANRSKTSGCSSAGMPGPSSATVSTTAPASGASRVVTVVPGGVCTRALASRFATTWCSRAASPGDGHRLVGQVELPAVFGAGDVRVADRVDDQRGQVDRFDRQRPAGVEPGQQQQVVDEAGHPGALRLHPAQRVGHVGGTSSRPRRASSA